MKRLNVLMETNNDNPIKVGLLVQQQRTIHFEYDAEWLAKGFSLSPYYLPLSAGLINDTTQLWQGLHGVFNDSLPDGWGLLLMDRQLTKLGIDPRQISPLERLAWLGQRTMGALTYQPTTGPDNEPLLIELNELANNAQQLFSGTSDEVLPQLFRAGGSPGGARPKALIASKGDQLVTADGKIPKGFTPWLVKFNAKDDFIDAGNVEYAYSLMAKDFGLKMPETQLMEGKYFAVKRFDKTATTRTHVHTLGNMIGVDYRLPALDYHDLFKVVLDVTKSRQELAKALRQMIFNIVVHNRDDHSKNFSFLYNEIEKNWKLTPAYDLMFSDGIQGEHTMTIAGEGRHPLKKHVMQLAEEFKMEKEASALIKQANNLIQQWGEYAEKASVSTKSKKIIEPYLGTCMK